MGIDNVSSGGKSTGTNYTQVKIRDKDSGKSIVIKFQNAKVTGNKAEWTILNGKVYDGNGNEVKDNTLNVTKYQQALIMAAASGEEFGEIQNQKERFILDEKDLTGASFYNVAKKALADVGSEYQIVKDPNNTNEGYFGEADALEHGLIFAQLKNQKGENGKLFIQLNDEKGKPLH